jgi:phosphoenolpyruvate synthase/pyruvate phosphate dikinase
MPAAIGLSSGGAGFAGQYESYPNVRGKSALLAAVRGCWASLWTARAITYGSAATSILARSQWLSWWNAWSRRTHLMCFTANRTTGARDELVISASFGLGEAVVSGKVTRTVMC